MLSCVYNGDTFTTKQEGFTIQDKYKLGQEKKLLCPVCKKPVFYCDEGKKIAYFVHYTVGDCPLGTLSSYDYGSSKKHLDLTDTFYYWLNQQFPDVKIVPDYLIDKELKTDLYFELNGTKIAIEIQFKRMNNPLFLKRTELYQKNNVKDIWFFVEEEEFTIGSPYHRSYYHSNEHELYFYVHPEGYCFVYKGTNREKWEEVGINTLYESVSLVITMNQISVGNNGRLNIPPLRKLLYEKILKIREDNKKEREAEKARAEAEQLLNEKLKSAQKPIFSSFIMPVNNIPQRKTVIQHESHKQDYEEYYFTFENGKEYLNIKIIYNMKVYDVKYLVLNRKGDKREQYLTCRKENENSSIRYSIDINPFLDSIKKVNIMKYEIL